MKMRLELVRSFGQMLAPLMALSFFPYANVRKGCSPINTWACYRRAHSYVFLTGIITYFVETEK